MNTKEFIAKANAVHMGKYRYDNSRYVNAREKIEITCKSHGNFFQRASSHLSGNGCKKCALEYTASLKLNTRIEALCETCKRPFSLTKSEHERGRKYCGKECAAKYNKYPEKACDICKQVFKPKNQKSRFCSIECTKRYNLGSRKSVIQRFNKKYGNRFSYSSSVYKGMNHSIKIICSLHGSFDVTPLQHLQGKICPNCKANEKQLAKKLKKAIKLSSLNCDEKQALINLDFETKTFGCKSCYGNFISRAHSSSNFCSKECSSAYYGNLKKQAALPNLNDVQDETFKLYGNKIEVRKLNYSSPKLHSAECICKFHGFFEITVGSLLQGSDCHFCTDRKINKSRFLERVEKDKQLKDRNYDYSALTEFEGAETRQTFICEKHGKFQQSIARHLAGDGCRQCSIDKRAKLNLEKAAKKWPQNAFDIHDCRYDYSKSAYLGAQIPTEIICPHHGSFFQQPNNHLNGAGCPNCANEVRVLGETISNLIKDGRNPEGRLYVLECFDDKEHFFKIGITSKTVELRYPSHTSMPYDYILLLEVDIGLIESFQIEQRILVTYSEFSFHPKKYFGGETECLSTNPCELDDDLFYLYNSEFNLAREIT